MIHFQPIGKANRGSACGRGAEVSVRPLFTQTKIGNVSFEPLPMLWRSKMPCLGLTVHIDPAAWDSALLEK
jgi:hypothetical protein